MCFPVTIQVAAPIPAPAPSASCIAISNVTRSTISAADACISTKLGTHYFDTNDICTSTVYYGTDGTCSSLYGSAAYVTTAGNVRYWTGSSWAGSCTGCP